jgi:hypothetical protein
MSIISYNLATVKLNSLDAIYISNISYNLSTVLVRLRKYWNNVEIRMCNAPVITESLNIK